MNASQRSFQFYKELPTWAKGIIAVGGLAILYFAGKSIFDRIKKDADKKNSVAAVNTASQDLSALLKSGMKLTFPNSQYETFAQKLFTAFSGWGTDNDQVAGVFYQLRNKADVLKLITVFGVRTIPDGIWNPAGDFTGDLAAVMADEMPQYLIVQINGYLTKNKIDYKF